MNLRVMTVVVGLLFLFLSGSSAFAIPESILLNAPDAADESRRKGAAKKFSDPEDGHQPEAPDAVGARDAGWMEKSGDDDAGKGEEKDYLKQLKPVNVRSLLAGLFKSEDTIDLNDNKKKLDKIPNKLTTYDSVFNQEYFNSKKTEKDDQDVFSRLVKATMDSQETQGRALERLIEGEKEEKENFAFSRKKPDLLSGSLDEENQRPVREKEDSSEMEFLDFDKDAQGRVWYPELKVDLEGKEMYQFYMETAELGKRKRSMLLRGEGAPCAAPVSSTPIMESVWLLGSGLLGCVGFRRKRKIRAFLSEFRRYCLA